jgi:hypothetical protein
MDIKSIIRKKKIEYLLGTSMLSIDENDLIDFLESIFNGNFDCDKDVYIDNKFVYRYDSKTKELKCKYFIFKDLNNVILKNYVEILFKIKISYIKYIF